MPLTDTAVRQAKAGDKVRKLADGAGLYLLVNRQGKYWRWDYRHAGKRKTMALGVYPDVSLAQARERHAVARAVLGAGQIRWPSASKISSAKRSPLRRSLANGGHIGRLTAASAMLHMS